MPSNLMDSRRRIAFPTFDITLFGFQRAARPYRLQSDDHTSGERHPTAMERVGLDGVDLAGRPPCRDEGVGDSQHQAAQGRYQHSQHRVEARQRRQALAQRQPEKQAVQDVDAAAHQCHHDAGERPHHRRKQDEAEFPGADEGAQPVRYFELGQRLGQAAPRFRALNDRTSTLSLPGLTGQSSYSRPMITGSPGQAGR